MSENSWEFSEVPQPSALPKPTAAALRPGALTTICIICIVLGALGIPVALQAGAMALFADQLQNMAAGMNAGAPQEIRQAMQDMQTATSEVNRRYQILNLAAALLHFVVAVALIYAGYKAMKLAPGSRKLLVMVLLGVILFEIVRGILVGMVQAEMAPIMKNYMQRLMSASGGQPGAEAGAQAGALITQISMIVGLVIAFGWIAVKIIFYGASAAYLNKQKTRALYEGAHEG